VAARLCNVLLDVSRATAIASLTRAYVAVYESVLVESRLKEIEARLEAKTDASRGVA
jgi:hypothetical protein